MRNRLRKWVFSLEYQTEVINKTALYTVDKQQKYPANQL